MTSAKEIEIAPISGADARALIRRRHYSGKVVLGSQLHLGVFLDGSLEGAMQFGPSMDKRRLQGLVADTEWNGFIELNRMAFSERLPRNSESRALSVAFRLMRKAYPHIEWIVSFADATQSGDGAIYRASGFVLAGIRKNTTLWGHPDGRRIANKTVHNFGHSKGASNGATSMRQYKADGWSPLPGFQLKYIYFLNRAARARLTVPELPFSVIEEMGAGMYLGKPRAKQAMAGPPAQRRGSADPHAPESI